MKIFKEQELEAVRMRSGKWAVRPTGQLGTCGFYPRAWTVRYVTAGTAKAAIAKSRS